MNAQSRSSQRSVDEWFATNFRVWDELYQQDVGPGRIYQRRQALAMHWVDSLGLRPAALVLELGCGAGNATLALARKGFRVIASDTVVKMLNLTRERTRAEGLDRSVTLAYGDAHALAFPDGVFELVLALGVIPWLHSPGEALAEMARVLGQGGFLIVSADNRMRLNQLFDPRLSPFGASTRRALRRLVRSPAPVNTLPALHSPGEMRALLRAAGLTVLSEATCGFFPFTFFTRPLLTGRLGAEIDGWLQHSADSGIPILNRLGAHYLTVCSR